MKLCFGARFNSDVSDIFCTFSTKKGAFSNLGMNRAVIGRLTSPSATAFFRFNIVVVPFSGAA
jgi:hypothetical protein